MNIQGKRNSATIRNLAIFIIAVLAIGWMGRGLDVLMGRPSAEGLGILLWLVAPLAASLSSSRNTISRSRQVRIG